MSEKHDSSYVEECKRLHDAASKDQKDYYIDPKTRAMVFTEHYHLQRGLCCGSRCRHCPYEHVNVPQS